MKKTHYFWAGNIFLGWHVLGLHINKYKYKSKQLQALYMPYQCSKWKAKFNWKYTFLIVSAVISDTGSWRWSSVSDYQSRETVANVIHPTCLCLLEEKLKALSLLLDVYARGSKISHWEMEIPCRGLTIYKN